MDAKTTARLLSRQRHDFTNHLQVIKGYLDLGMPEMALRSLDEADRKLKEESRVFQILSPEAAVLFCELQMVVRHQGVRLSLDRVNADPAEPLLPTGLALLGQEIKDKVNSRKRETDARVSCDALPDRLIMQLEWLGEEGPEHSDIVLTR